MILCLADITDWLRVYKLSMLLVSHVFTAVNNVAEETRQCACLIADYLQLVSCRLLV